MSQENVDLVRLAYDVAFAQRSIEGVRHAFPEDYVFHTRAEWPGRRLYRMNEMTQLWADLDDIFSEYSLVPEEFATVGDDYVVVTIKVGFRMRGSDARIEQRVFHVWNVRDGKPRETRAFGNRDEARRATQDPRR